MVRATGTCRSPEDGFEKSCIGRESVDGAAQGHLRSALQVARGCQRRCGAGLVHFGAGGVSAARECAMPLRHRGSARGSSLMKEVQGVALQNEAAKVFWNKTISLAPVSAHLFYLRKVDRCEALPRVRVLGALITTKLNYLLLMTKLN